MLAKPDHIAYVIRDLDEAIPMLGGTLGLEMTMRFELPDFSLRGLFLSNGSALIEVFQLLTAELAEPRLGGLDLRLDHVGYEVASIEDAMTSLRQLGIRFAGPDGIEVDSPIELGDSLHLWTMIGSPLRGLGLQLIERSPQRI